MRDHHRDIADQKTCDYTEEKVINPSGHLFCTLLHELMTAKTRVISFECSPRNVMKIAQIKINNFRGVKSAELLLPDHVVFVGDNNTGKSTVLEAIDLVLGPERLHRISPIDEHDFYAGEYIGTERSTDLDKGRGGYRRLVRLNRSFISITISNGGTRRQTHFFKSHRQKRQINQRSFMHCAWALRGNTTQKKTVSSVRLSSCLLKEMKGQRIRSKLAINASVGSYSLEH